MSEPSNPFGLHSITPYLIVEQVPELVCFLEDVLGATVRGDIRRRPDGSVMHAEIQIGDSVVMLGEPTEDFPAKPGTLYTYVEDCDATFQKAIEYGAKEMMPPSTFPHGDRYGGIEDLSGNLWFVVTHQGTPETQND